MCIFSVTNEELSRFSGLGDSDLAPRAAPAIAVLEARLLGRLSPATRDQAFSFDAGRVLMNAFEQVRSQLREDPCASMTSFTSCFRIG